MRSVVRGVFVLLVFAVPRSAQSQDAASPPSATEFAALQAQIRELSGRLAELEARLKAVEGTPLAPAEAGAVAPAPNPPVASGAGAASSKIFNPDIAVIGNVTGGAGRNAASNVPSIEFHEGEVSMQAVVDPFARGDFYFAFSPEGVEVEEAFITFPELPGGLLAKAGKMRASFGRVNTMHAHVAPWIDRPLVNVNLTGGEEGIADAGLSLSRLFPNKVLFLEATGEVYRGESSIFSARKRGDVSLLGRLRGYRDLSESTNIDVGGSIVRGQTRDALSGATRVIGVDATLRYRPLRRAIYSKSLLRTEAFWRRTGFENRAAFGAYAYLEHQFARRWSAGLRYDRSARADDPEQKDRSTSFLVSFRPSEFSQLRGQFRRDSLAFGQTSNTFLFQLLFAIGAHGAHPF